MLIRFQIFFIFTSLFVSIGKSQNVGFSNSEADKQARKDIEISKIDLFSKSPYVFDGQAVSSYCYKSRSGEILTMFKFQIRHVFKGKENLHEGYVYIIEKYINGMTQDGSNVGKIVSEPEIEINVGQKNVILLCNSYSDTTILPRNTEALQGILLIPDYVINVRTKDEVPPNDWQGPGGYFLRYIHSADSLYSYLNSLYPFIDKIKVETNLNEDLPKIKIRMEDTITYGYNDLKVRAQFPGGRDSLSKIVISEFDRNILPAEYRKSDLRALIFFYVNTDGSLFNLAVHCVGNKDIEKEIYRIVFSHKNFIPAIHNNGKIVKSFGAMELKLFFK